MQADTGRAGGTAQPPRLSLEPDATDYSLFLQRLRLLDMVQRVAHSDVMELVDTVGLDALTCRATTGAAAAVRAAGLRTRRTPLDAAFEEEDEGNDKDYGHRRAPRPRSYMGSTGARMRESGGRDSGVSPMSRPRPRDGSTLSPTPASTGYHPRRTNHDLRVAAAADALRSPTAAGRERWTSGRPYRSSVTAAGRVDWARLAQPRHRPELDDAESAGEPVMEAVYVYGEARDGAAHPRGDPREPDARAVVGPGLVDGYRASAPHRSEAEADGYLLPRRTDTYAHTPELVEAVEVGGSDGGTSPPRAVGRTAPRGAAGDVRQSTHAAPTPSNTGAEPGDGARPSMTTTMATSFPSPFAAQGGAGETGSDGAGPMASLRSDGAGKLAETAVDRRPLAGDPMATTSTAAAALLSPLDAAVPPFAPPREPTAPPPDLPSFSTSGGGAGGGGEHGNSASLPSRSQASASNVGTPRVVGGGRAMLAPKAKPKGAPDSARVPVDVIRHAAGILSRSTPLPPPPDQPERLQRAGVARVGLDGSPAAPVMGANASRSRSVVFASTAPAGDEHVRDATASLGAGSGDADEGALVRRAGLPGDLAPASPSAVSLRAIADSIDAMLRDHQRILKEVVQAPAEGGAAATGGAQTARGRRKERQGRRGEAHTETSTSTSSLPSTLPTGTDDTSSGSAEVVEVLRTSAMLQRKVNAMDQDIARIQARSLAYRPPSHAESSAELYEEDVPTPTESDAGGANTGGGGGAAAPSQEAPAAPQTVRRPRRVRGSVPEAMVRRILSYQKMENECIAYNEKLWNTSTVSQYVFAQRLTNALLEDCLDEVTHEVSCIMEEYVDGLADHELQ